METIYRKKQIASILNDWYRGERVDMTDIILKQILRSFELPTDKKSLEKLVKEGKYD